MDQTKIERVQKRATKLVASVRKIPFESMLQNLKLESLHYRRKKADMVQTFMRLKNITRVDPSPALFFITETKFL